jgi:hypothetical protein
MVTMSLRVPRFYASALKALARALGVSVSEVVRMAIVEYVERAAQRRLRRSGEEDWAAFDLVIESAHRSSNPLYFVKSP